MKEKIPGRFTQDTGGKQLFWEQTSDHKEDRQDNPS